MMLFYTVAAATLFASTVAVEFTVKSTGGNATSQYQYGLMFEDINNSGDGGVYAELVQNRAFQGDEIFPSTLDFWSAVGNAKLSLQNLSDPLSSALPTSMRVTGSGDGVGFSNEGFWGFPVVSTWTYEGSFWMKGDYSGNISVNLQSLEKRSWAEAQVPVSSTSGWTQYNYTLKPSEDAPNSNNTLVFTYDAEDDSSLDFNLISLFPPTYNDRPNGLRIDLMEAMADLKPSFFRVPGGNNVEGLQSPFLWNWTETLGPLKDRRGYPGTWSYENTNGLGLVEYMLWAQDLGMEPLLGIWSGLWLDGTVVPEDELQPYVQFALDELEFLMGDTSSKWGAVRASLGYPDPFPIKFVEVGNEDSLSGGGPSYRAYRFDAFYNAIHEAYPDITIIASFYDVDGATPPYDAAGDFHEYAIPVQMSNQFGFFDNYTSDHPVLIGEYAIVEYDQPGTDAPSWDEGAPRAFQPFWYGTVAEAVFLLGAERNSHAMIGAAYAPMFQNLNRWEWIPDLISYDANPAHTTKSTSYEMVKLLSGTRITENLPMEGADFDPAYYVSGRSAMTGSHILKAAVYNSTGSVPFQVTFEGISAGTSGQLTYLTAPMNASNPIGGSVVETHTSSVVASGDGVFSFKLPDYSIAVFEVAASESDGGNNRHGWQGWKTWGPGGGRGGHTNQWGQGWF